ncbi:MAG: DUF6503 family protein, partial [Flavobacteriaceae bacterium]|nr:DUF6503 family protein [Flavobacteriaceae bacterium]
QKSNSESSPSPAPYIAENSDVLMNECIDHYGFDDINNKKFAFTFRSKKFDAQFKNGKYLYTSVLKDSTGSTIDSLWNDGFSRHKNGDLVTTPEVKLKGYAATLNSIVYFALLPYGLNHEGVLLGQLDTMSFGDTKYYLIAVDFASDDPEAHNDSYMYWINSTNKSIDYLAYYFCDEYCDYRFRVKTKEHHVDGFRFQDYDNYKPTDSILGLTDLMTAYKNNRLKKVSEIKLEAIQVSEAEF